MRALNIAPTVLEPGMTTGRSRGPEGRTRAVRLGDGSPARMRQQSLPTSKYGH